MCVLGNGSKTRLKKNTFSILLRRPRAQARAPAKKDGKYKLAAEKIMKKCWVLAPFGVGGVYNRGTNKLYPRKRHFFVMEKCIEDTRQEEKHVPDPLEAIMRPTDPVKEELRQNLFKMHQFRPKITKIKVSTFWILEIRCFPAGGQCQPSRPVGFKQ